MSVGGYLDRGVIRSLCPERRYQYLGHALGLGRSRTVPWLQMRRDWLAAAGFDIRAPVRVRLMRGCLMLTVE